jgi:hypothetical protein
MVGRWQADDVDVACESWAHQWVANFGLPPDRAGRAIGPLGCTLGRVRELHDGASSSTERAGQHWPEVFLGQGLVVAVALRHMSEMQRLVVEHHYIRRWYDPTTWARMKRPTKQSVIAQRLGLSLSEYYTRRDTAKACIRTCLCVDTKVLARAHSQMASSGQASELPLQPS